MNSSGGCANVPLAPTNESLFFRVYRQYYYMATLDIIDSKNLTREDEVFPILDSSLISRTNLKKYNIKLVDCGEYTQVYFYQNPNFVSHNKDNTDLYLKKQKCSKLLEENENDCIEFNGTYEIKKQNASSEELTYVIQEKNIIRSKLSCQRIAKANIDKWETFITLTFKENMNDIKIANEKFNNFTKQIRRHKKDFAYIAIPEFQKRGAVHYHLLTNISINDTILIFSQEDNPKFKHVKYWKHGFTSVEIMKGDIKKVVGYISKYMTKNIDNRLFGKRRFFYSQNLTMPKENYIDSSNNTDEEFYKKRIQDKELIYQNEYINPYDGSLVTFLEFTSSNNNILQ